MQIKIHIIYSRRSKPSSIHIVGRIFLATTIITTLCLFFLLYFILFKKVPPSSPIFVSFLFRFFFGLMPLLLLSAATVAIVVLDADDSSFCKISGCLRNRKYTQSKCISSLIADIINASTAFRDGVSSEEEQQRIRVSSTAFITFSRPNCLQA